MSYIPVVTSGVLKGYAWGEGGPIHYPLYKPLYAFSLDACLCMYSWDKLKLTVCLLSASQHHNWVFPLCREMEHKLRRQISYKGLPRILGGLLHTYWHLLSGADEVSRESCQLATAILDESDNLTCCDSHKVMTSRIIIMKFWFS